jgi:hypothetical protein
MLAMTKDEPMQDVWAMANAPEPSPEQLFPWWNVLRVEANRERKAADWLLDQVAIHAYWPNFPKQMRGRGKITLHRACSVMPGLLFVPTEFLIKPRRKEIFDYIHAYGFMMSCDRQALFSKAHIEIIREIEAKLNLPDNAVGDAVGARLEVGVKVRFLNDVYAAFIGDGVIVEVASPTRIGVEVSQLFGCRQTVYTLASEIEVM